MMYFIDHDKKRIHRQLYAGDRCGFTGTPVEHREFTDCPAYTEGLITKEQYHRCPYCVSVQTTLAEDSRAYAD
ncbi:hypothetical protein ACTL32_04445 [Planococcus sp. FY231025]|uniref:hypothetical protein n=1 Tax=Planococcus sp. FY231025 TaxID=3455699 RepID=UPI003F8EE934